MADKKRAITLQTSTPISHMSTNDGHLFSICGDEASLGILSCNGLDMGYSITKGGNHEYVYDCYMKIQEKGAVIHIEKEKDIFHSQELFENFIHSHLLSKEYVILDLDVSKIFDYKIDSDLPTLHSPLVSGIDLEAGKIELSDFFDFRHYSKKWVGIEEVYEAYKVIQNYIVSYKSYEDDLWIKKISLLKLKSNVQNLISNFVKSIEEYLNPRIEFISSNEPSSFYLVLNRIRGLKDVKDYPELIETGSGINVYYFLGRYLQREGDRLDYNFVKSICLLDFHFLVLKKAINFLMKSGNLKDVDYSGLLLLSKLAASLKMLVFKNYYHNHKDSKAIISVLNDLKSNEFIFLESVQDSLRGGTDVQVS